MKPPRPDIWKALTAVARWALVSSATRRLIALGRCVRPLLEIRNDPGIYAVSAGDDLPDEDAPPGSFHGSRPASLSCVMSTTTRSPWNLAPLLRCSCAVPDIVTGKG